MHAVIIAVQASLAFAGLCSVALGFTERIHKRDKGQKGDDMILLKQIFEVWNR